MTKFTFSFNDSQVVITDAKNNAEKIDLIDKLETIESLKAISHEQNAAVKASAGALSLLADMLQDPRFDFYKGNCPINEKIPREFNLALREKISEYMKPAFIADKMAKGAKQSTADNQWIQFSAGLNTGSFSNAKTWAGKFFCQLGKLPTTDNGKLLPLRAIIKMLENAKIPSENEGIAGKLVKLSSEVESRTEKTDLGEYATAIAALKSMLATYEGLYRESLEALSALAINPDIQNQAQSVIVKAQEKPSIESIEALHDNGQIDDTTYAIMMLEHHNIEVVFEEDEAPF